MKVEWRLDGWVVEGPDLLLLVENRHVDAYSKLAPTFAAEVKRITAERAEAYERHWDLEGPHA